MSLSPPLPNLPENKVDKYGKAVARHFVEVLGSMTFATPMLTSLELYVENLTPVQSIDARTTALSLSLLLVFPYTKLRRYIKEKLNIQGKQALYDLAYTGVFTGLVTTGIYLSNGMPLKKALTGGAVAGLAGCATGIPMGLGVDLYRTLFDVVTDQPRRIFRGIARWPPLARYMLATALSSASAIQVHTMYTHAVDKDNLPPAIIRHNLESRITNTSYKVVP